MLKYLSVCVAVIGLATGGASAQQREAVLQRVAIAGAAFDLAVISVKPDAPVLDLREEIDPLLVHVAGGELVLAYDDGAQSIFPQIESMLSPSCTFNVNGKTSVSRAPVAIYMVPKAD